jgi:hypothetical protein
MNQIISEEQRRARKIESYLAYTVLYAQILHRQLEGVYPLLNRTQKTMFADSLMVRCKVLISELSRMDKMNETAIEELEDGAGAIVSMLNKTIELSNDDKAKLFTMIDDFVKERNGTA